MLRMTQWIREALNDQPGSAFEGVILIWNLTNTCNLQCHHCYASANAHKSQDLSLDEIQKVIPDLKKLGVHFVILSGGEPLVRKDIYQIAKSLRNHRMISYLSTNGLLIRAEEIQQIKEHFDYVGISIDGTPEVHDHFRGKKGAYQQSLHALRLCRDAGIKTGVRFTLTRETYSALPHLFELAKRERFPKIYLSHLVYSGRAAGQLDVTPEQYRESMKFILDEAFAAAESGCGPDVVTGNNEADAVFLLEEFKKRYPDRAFGLERRLKNWGGNQAGVRLMNIDSRGFVRPDPFFKDALGNVRNQDVGSIWQSNHPVLKVLRGVPRVLGGKCRGCSFIQICNGNSRARAHSFFGSYEAEDPACVLQ